MIPGKQPKLLLTLDEVKGDGKLTLDGLVKELMVQMKTRIGSW